jgi:hypothetical protein
LAAGPAPAPGLRPGPRRCRGRRRRRRLPKTGTSMPSTSVRCARIHLTSACPMVGRTVSICTPYRLSLSGAAAVICLRPIDLPTVASMQPGRVAADRAHLVAEGRASVPRSGTREGMDRRDLAVPAARSWRSRDNRPSTSSDGVPGGMPWVSARSDGPTSTPSIPGTWRTSSSLARAARVSILHQAQHLLVRPVGVGTKEQP